MFILCLLSVNCVYNLFLSIYICGNLFLLTFFFFFVTFFPSQFLYLSQIQRDGLFGLGIILYLYLTIGFFFQLKKTTRLRLATGLKNFSGLFPENLLLQILSCAVFQSQSQHPHSVHIPFV